LRSTNFFFQFLDKIEEIVINPSGGFTAFFEINFNACLKLQNVTGYCG